MTEALQFLATHPYVALWLGWGSHLLYILGEVSAKVGRPVSPLAFVLKRPYRVGGSVLAAQIGYGIALSQSEAGVVAYEVAAGIGLACELVADRASNVAGYRRKQTRPEAGGETDLTTLAREFTDTDTTRPRGS